MRRDLSISHSPIRRGSGLVISHALPWVNGRDQKGGISLKKVFSVQRPFTQHKIKCQTTLYLYYKAPCATTLYPSHHIARLYNNPLPTLLNVFVCADPLPTLDATTLYLFFYFAEQDFSGLSYNSLRAEAALHAKLRGESFQKAVHARSKKQYDVASYYAQQVSLCGGRVVDLVLLIDFCNTSI